MSLTFTSTVRLRSNNEKPGSWHFVTLPWETATEIKKLTASLPRKGRWSVRVQARIGFVKRTTSIFPDKKSWSYLLPIKADVRKELHIEAGDEIAVELVLLD
jgi:hypothetical protein